VLGLPGLCAGPEDVGRYQRRERFGEAGVRLSGQVHPGDEAAPILIDNLDVVEEREILVRCDLSRTSMR
jgi:hypothetical protein